MRVDSRWLEDLIVAIREQDPEEDSSEVVCWPYTMNDQLARCSVRWPLPDQSSICARFQITCWPKGDA